jgi:hypothetical protein
MARTPAESHHVQFGSIAGVVDHLMRIARLLAVVLALCLATVGCGGSGSASAPSAPVASKKAACQNTFGPALRVMRSFMAEVDAGMTVGTFDDKYPTLAGPVQLANDASAGSSCPTGIGIAVNSLYQRVKKSSQGPVVLANWNASYEHLQAQIAALP